MSRMVIAVRSGAVVDEYGVRHEIEPGLTRWSTNCPELADPKVAAMFGLASSSRSASAARSAAGGSRKSTAADATVAEARPKQGERPSWYLGHTEPRPRTEEELQRTARHEAGHAAAAYLLGWEIGTARLGTELELGEVEIRSSRDLDPKVRARQYATISLAAKENVGWTYDDVGGNGIPYRGDRRQAWQALARVSADPRETGRLFEQARAEAKRLTETSTFKWIARAVERELLEQGELRQPELGRLLQRAKSGARNERGRP